MRIPFSLLLALSYGCTISAQSRPRLLVPISEHVSSITLHEQVSRILAMPAHCHDRINTGELQMRLRNVVIDSSLLWLHLQIFNRSRINFQPAFCRVMIRSPNGTKRKAVQSLEMIPFRRPMLGTVRYRHTYDLVIPFVPFALIRPQRLVIELGESRSGRLLLLRVPAKRILHASSLP